MFTSMDADQDGKVTRAEHAAAAKKKFADIDVDKDGSVAVAEMFKKLDSNNDGTLSLEECDAGGGATDKAKKY